MRSRAQFRMRSGSRRRTLLPAATKFRPTAKSSCSALDRTRLPVPVRRCFSNSRVSRACARYWAESKAGATIRAALVFRLHYSQIREDLGRSFFHGQHVVTGVAVLCDGFPILRLVRIVVAAE